jgi:hypothetical protein
MLQISDFFTICGVDAWYIGAHLGRGGGGHFVATTCLCSLNLMIMT